MLLGASKRGELAVVQQLPADGGHMEGVRVAVVTTLAVAAHLVNTPAAALPNIPPEIWRVILNFLARRDWPTRGGPVEPAPVVAL